MVYIENVLRTGLADIELCRAAAVEDQFLFIAVEAVCDGGDLTEADGSTGLAGDDDEVLESLCALALVIESQQQVFVSAFEPADRTAYALTIYRVGDIRCRQAILAHAPGGDFDTDVVVGETADHNFRNIDLGRHAVFQVLGIGFERDRIFRSGYRHRDHGIGACQLFDDRWFSLLGKIIDRIDL